MSCYLLCSVISQKSRIIDNKAAETSGLANITSDVSGNRATEKQELILIALEGV